MALNLTLSRLPWYGQVGVFAGLSAIALGLFWQFYATGVEAEHATKREQLSRLQIEIATALATAQRGDAFKREVADLENQLTLLRAVLPEEQDVADSSTA